MSSPFLPPSAPEPPAAPPFARQPLPPAPPVWDAAPPAVPGAAPGKRKGWLWVLLACVVCAAVVGGVVVLAGRDSSAPTRSTSTLAAPSDGVTHAGESGWVMSLAPTWEPFEMTSFANEGMWTTGRGSATFGNNVNVFVESPPVDMSLDTYMEFSEDNSEAIIAGVVVAGNEIVDAGDHEYGRMEYSAEMEGTELSFLAIVVKVDGSFVVATYTALTDLYPAEVGSVEPYMVTLRAA